MDFFNRLIGEGTDLSLFQIGIRSVIIFIVCLFLIRISGRRAFGMRMPFDNVITILLGAILSRGITGQTPFMGVLSSALIIVLLHRVCAWYALYNDRFGCLIKGKSELIYKEGYVNSRKMKKCLVSEKDLMEGIRENSNLDSFHKVKAVFIERDGAISVVKKDQD